MRKKNDHSNDEFSIEESILIERLRSFRVPAMVEEYKQQLRDPNANLLPFEERFARIVNAEWLKRYNKKFNDKLKKAKLRFKDADLDETIYDPARKLDTQAIELLSKCEWVEEGKNLLITGMSGSGKTYFSCALGIAALRQLKDVNYIKASVLMRELERARKKDTYMEYLEEKLAFDLLVIDDFGLMDLDLDKCRDLFEVIDGRDGRRSTIIISQFPVESWYDMFSNATYAEACLSRITDKKHAYRLEMNGRSMRG
ncbi:MAG: ATP-binding protein [Oscillospiraceae bacterium]|nr:ATP-binding protein [Oscillospiraceae bacterium]